MPNNFSEAVKKDLKTKYTAEIEQKLIPKFKQMTAFLKNEYLPASKTSSGIGSFNFGPELYATYAKQWTTTNMSPTEIHELGLKEVSRLNAEMEKVKIQVGFKGTLKEFLNSVRDKKELKPFKNLKKYLLILKKYMPV